MFLKNLFKTKKEKSFFLISVFFSSTLVILFHQTFKLNFMQNMMPQIFLKIVLWEPLPPSLGKCHYFETGNVVNKTTVLISLEFIIHWCKFLTVPKL